MTAQFGIKQRLPSQYSNYRFAPPKGIALLAVAARGVSLPPSRQLSNGDGVIVSPIRRYHTERGREMRLRKVQGDVR